MFNKTALLSTLITANHILHHFSILDSFGHISIRNPLTNTTFFLALQLGPAVVSSPADIGEYYIEDGRPVAGTVGGYAERYIHSEVLRRYDDVNAVVHSHAEDVLPYTVVGGVDVGAVYHMAGFLGDSVPNFDIADFYKEDDKRDLLVNTARLGAALASQFGINATRPSSPLHSVVLQRGHGFVTVGSSVEQVTDFAYYVASNARVQTRALMLGGGREQVRFLSERERRDAADMNRWIVFKPWRQWVTEVERSGRYVNELGTPPIPDS